MRDERDPGEGDRCVCDCRVWFRDGRTRPLLVHGGTSLHDVNRELYTVVFTRDRGRISSFEGDTIRASAEACADTMPALA
ncbi:MAG: hypothetical protein AB7S61_07345 [Methanoregulaceae archaeon]